MFYLMLSVAFYIFKLTVLPNKNGFTIVLKDGQNVSNLFAGLAFVDDDCSKSAIAKQQLYRQENSSLAHLKKSDCGVCVCMFVLLFLYICTQRTCA